MTNLTPLSWDRTGSGPAGQWWHIDHHPDTTEQTATVSAYIVQVPPAQPGLWTHHMVSAIHLRDIPGCPPPHRFAPDMTHEILSLSLDPAHDPFSNPAHYLEPADFIAQVRASTDGIIETVLRHAVEAVVRGHIQMEGPGPGNKLWSEFWQDILQETVDHCENPMAHRPDPKG